MDRGQVIKGAKFEESVPDGFEFAAAAEVSDFLFRISAEPAEKLGGVAVDAPGEEASVEYEFVVGHVVSWGEEVAAVFSGDELPVNGSEEFGPGLFARWLCPVEESESEGKFLDSGVFQGAVSISYCPSCRMGEVCVRESNDAPGPP